MENGKKILVDLFGACLAILAWTKCGHVTKHVLSITHFHSCFYLTFPFKFYFNKTFKLSINDYLLLIYTFMCMIIFLMKIILSFQSHQTHILSEGLGIAWNREWRSWSGIFFKGSSSFRGTIEYENSYFQMIHSKNIKILSSKLEQSFF